MFTTLILFLAIFLSIILFILDAFKWQIILFLGFLIVCIIVKTMKQVKKFGVDNVFGAFKEKKMPLYQQEIIMGTLKSHRGYRKIYRLEHYYSDYLVIDESGIYCLKLLEYSGTISGDITYEYLTLKNAVNFSIPNIFVHLDKDCEDLEKLFHEEILIVVIKKDSCLIKTVFPKKYQFISFKNFYYQSRSLFTKKKYTKEQILQFEQLFLSNCK